jgi:hypothetical protein
MTVACIDEFQCEAVQSAPWESNPYGLIGWGEMLYFSAQRFFWASYSLQEIRTNCFVKSIPVAGDEKIFALPHPLDDFTKSDSVNRLEHVEKIFGELGMTISAETAKEVYDALKEDSPRKNFQWLIDQIDGLRKLAVKEMNNKAFFYVSSERAKFFPRMDDQHIFGQNVATAFPSAAFDIAESGICLALARGSASVFHLMRVLEIGLTALGTQFGVSLAHTNWAPAITEIERKVRNMNNDAAWKDRPDCKTLQEFYAQAASHFGVLKDAWRNHTMLARGAYTEEQAERVFENVKGFMQKLSERLSE